MNQVVNMKSLKETVLYLVIAIVVVTQCEPAAITTGASNESPNYNQFAADLFSRISEGRYTDNIVYSPAAIQTSMALTFIGAEGETAEEMRKVLRLGDDDKIQIAEDFCKLLGTLPNNINLTDEAPKLRMINRLYINQQLEISPEFNAIAIEYFDTRAETVNFNDSKMFVENVNQWVAQQTECKIKDLLKADAVDSDTNVVLVNAIYFKAKWLNPFSQSSTSRSKFYTKLNVSQEAEIMYNEEYYGYAELPELEATALEMPYNNSDLTMLIILPNEIEGLPNLELQLRNKDLNDITDKMLITKVHAHVPQFRIEFDIDLKEPLEQMGLATTFSPSANFKSLFTTSELQSISKVRHKAFLDVNEAGSEAAAATFVTLTNLSGYFDEPIFRADHPFMFAIRSKSVVYFAGHVATI